VLMIFTPLQIRRLRPGLNPRTWVLNASTLPLDHRSRLASTYEYRQKLAVVYDRFASVLQRARTSKNFPLGTRTIEWISQLTFQSLVVYTTCCTIMKVLFVEKYVYALNMTATLEAICFLKENKYLISNKNTLCSPRGRNRVFMYRGADKSLARPSPQCILFDGQNISFDASLVLCIYTYIYIYMFLQL
jgi:hypothetical protein